MEYIILLTFINIFIFPELRVPQTFGRQYHQRSSLHPAPERHLVLPTSFEQALKWCMEWLLWLWQKQRW
jgi:hypothetical protein